MGIGSYDYADMRIETTVPAGTFGLTYDFAMFSTEYRGFHQTSDRDVPVLCVDNPRGCCR